MGNLFNHTLLLEGARDRALEQFIPYFQKRGMEVNISWVKQTLMSKFVNEANIHNLSLGGNYYLVGVARYYFNGDLTTNKRLGILYNNVRDNFNIEVCQRLDALINILRNAYIDSVGTKWEQPEDFGTLSIQQLLKKYNAKINKELGIETISKNVPVDLSKPAVSNDYTAGKNYTYEIITSFEQCKKYNAATTPGAWCITYGKQHYDAYIKLFKKRYGGIHYVVFRQNGYENIPRKVGAGFTKKKPHDAYGNSLICVLQRNDCAEPTYITSRWNHGSTVDGTSGTEADHAYTTQEFLQTIGCDGSILTKIFEQWKALGGKDNEELKRQRAEERAEGRAEKMTALRALKYMQMLMNGGANPFAIQIPGFQIGWKTFGWNPKDWTEKMGIEFIDRDNAPQKYPYTISIIAEDGNRKYYTIMDRKVLMFNQYFEEEANLKGSNESFVSVGGQGWSSLYDRRRHCFFDIDGVTKFNYSSPQKGIVFGSFYQENEVTDKYAILAVTGNQVALLNLKTMKPVKARNGSAWFESITNIYGESNHDGRGRVSLPYSFEDSLLKLVYDSASGEQYIFNTKTDSMVDVYADVPEGWVLYARAGERYKPGTRYLMFIDNQEASTTPWNHDFAVSKKIFKNADDGSFFSINGITQFISLYIEGDVAAYMVDTENVYYYDLARNKSLELNGQPIVTKHGTDTLNNYGDFIAISLCRYVLRPDGSGLYTYGTSYLQELLYNPYTGEFYHDDISGYVFKLYGQDHSKTLSRIKAYIPEDKVDLVPDNLKVDFGSGDNYNKYYIPNAQELAAKSQANESRVLRDIIRETLFTELKNLL